MAGFVLSPLSLGDTVAVVVLALAILTQVQAHRRGRQAADRAVQGSEARARAERIQAALEHQEIVDVIHDDLVTKWATLLAVVATLEHHFPEDGELSRLHTFIASEWDRMSKARIKVQIPTDHMNGGGQ